MANVAIIDKSETMRAVFGALFYHPSPHKVVLEAGSFQEALSRISLAKERQVRLVILGEMGGGDQEIAIARALCKAMPDIKIISVSRSKREIGDIELMKSPAGYPSMIGFLEAVTKLLEVS